MTVGRMTGHQGEIYNKLPRWDHPLSLRGDSYHVKFTKFGLWNVLTCLLRRCRWRNQSHDEEDWCHLTDVLCDLKHNHYLLQNQEQHVVLIQVSLHKIWEQFFWMEKYVHRRNVILRFILWKKGLLMLTVGIIHVIAIEPTNACLVQGCHHREFKIIFIASDIGY